MKDDYEKMLRSRIEVLKDRLKKAELVLEEIQEKIECGEVEYNYQWHMENIEVEKYQKEIIEIEEIIPKLRKQYKNLDNEDINTYREDISDLKSKLEEIISKKQLLEPQVSLIEDDKHQQWILEESIKSNTRIMENAMQINNSEIENQVNDIADLWTTIMEGNGSKRGIMKVKAKFYYKREPGERDWYPDKEEYIEIYCTRLEYEIFKIQAKRLEERGISSETLFKNKGAWRKDWDSWQYGPIHTSLGEFVDYDKLSLAQKDKIGKQKQKKEKRIKKLQEKSRKHPQIYDRIGTVLGIEVTQSELIKNGVDPEVWEWEEIEKAKVASKDIARVSKEKGVKKSLVSQFSSLFSRKKEDKDR